MSIIDDLADMRDELSGEDSGGHRARRAAPRKLGLTTGRVVAPTDPLPLGRVMVRVPSVDGLDIIALARVVTPGGSFFSGIYWIPNPEDEVVLMFEEGDPDSAYILGGVWNGLQMPPMLTPLPQIRTIRSPLGSQIVFSELPVPMLWLQAGPTPPDVIPFPPNLSDLPSTVMLNPTGVVITAPTLTIKCGLTAISVSAAGVGIVAPSLSFVAGGSLLSMSPAGITMAGAQVSITTPAAMSINAGGVVAVNAGGATTVNAGAALVVNAGGAATVTGGGAVMLASAGAVVQSSPTTAMVPKPLT